MKGRIHSIETLGTVDGPGLRYIIFTQGCLLRCQFCHNPDTWKMSGGKEMTVEELVADIVKYKDFFDSSGGGVTVSGGEPLIQAEFLLELFTELKKHDIHTCIDSSGGCFSRAPHFIETLDKLMDVTDLILYDLKQIDPEKHKVLTGVSNDHILDMARYLDEKNVPIWVRHVLIPGGSDDDVLLQRLSDFIATLSNVERIDVLPYHKLGVYKWENLGLDYQLEGVEPPTEDRVKNAEAILNREKTIAIPQS
jgi:pyruvate formate lyase activating enzyme